MTKLTGEFEVTSWDENAFLELDGGRKLTRVEVSQRFRGGVTGTGTVVWLMSYAEDGTARFVGMQHVQGAVEGRDGGFVMETAGDFDAEKAGDVVRHPFFGDGKTGWDPRRGPLRGAARSKGVVHA